LPIQFGLLEASLLVLFVMGYVNRRPWVKHKKLLRWVSMLAGLVLLGVVYTQPLTISVISRFLLGHWPEWRSNLYWYLLLGGMLLFYLVENQNAYCEWFCPFGAAQECLGAIGRASPHSGGKYRGLLTWLQRGLAWIALLVALLFRNPGLTSYEIFGVFFTLQGSRSQFVLLGMVLGAAFFVRRPWCRFLCPIRPISDWVRLLRRWIGELWQTVNA
jgi:polyferredoxin